MQILRGHAEGLIGLHEDSIGAVVVVEVVDIFRSHEYAERGRDLGERNVHRLGLLAVDGDQFLGVVSGEGRDEAGQILAGVAGVHNLMGDAIEVADGVTAGILQLELKATKAADALDGGGFEHGNQAAIGREQETAEFGREVGHDVGSGVAFAAPLIGGFGADEHEALVGGAPGKAEAHYRERADDIGIGSHDGLGAVSQCAGVGERGARGRLHDDEEVALIFLGNEAGGHALVDPHRCAQAGEEDQQQKVAELQGDVDGLAVAPSEPADGGIGAVNE